MPKKNFLALGECLAIVYLIAFFSGKSNCRQSMEWYATLNLSLLTPPGYVFGIVWPLLYTLIGLALWEVTKAIQKKVYPKRAVFPFFIQLGLNALWSPLFFGLENPKLAFFVVVALWATLIQNMWYYRRLNPRFFIYFLPYLLWITFAVYLNLYIIIYN